MQQLPLPLRNLVQENPLTRLKALTQLRATFDLLEEDLVAQALRYPDITFEDVAHALGLKSASQANRRYRHLAPEAKRRTKGTTLPRSAARRRKAIDELPLPADHYAKLSFQRDLEFERAAEEEARLREEGGAEHD
jgi:hypothetical protein